MKIAIISPFYPLRGGIANFADALADALEVEHEVLRVSFCRQYPKILFPGKTQYVDQPSKELVKARFLLDSVNPWTQRRTAKCINDFNPDVVLTAYWMPFIANSVKGVLNKVNSSTKKLAVVHNYLSHEAKFYDKWIVSNYIKSHDGVIALSKLVKSQVQSAVSDLPVKHLPHPVYAHFGQKLDRAEAAKSIGVDPEKKTLLFFGLIRDYKGLDILLETAKNLDESFQVVVAGECYGSFDKYQAIIEENELSGQIIVHQKFIADKDVAAYFSVADVCVLPYRSATQSGVTAIANFFHVPVVATRVGGLGEFVEHGVDGLLVDPESPSELEKGITGLFKGEELDKMRRELKRRPVNTWSEFATQTVDFAGEIQP